VVLLKALESRGVLATQNAASGGLAGGGRPGMVLVLVLLPPLRRAWRRTAANRRAICWQRWLTPRGGGVHRADAGGSRRFFPWLLWRWRAPARANCSRCAWWAALGIAYGSSALFGVSFALGAFFAGMVMRESALSYRAPKKRCRCAMRSRCCSFVSVGMLFDRAC